MGDGRFALRAEDLHVQVRQAAGRGHSQPQRQAGLQRLPLQKVVERTMLVVVRDEPQLRARVAGSHVRGYKAYGQRVRWLSQGFRAEGVWTGQGQGWGHRGTESGQAGAGAGAALAWGREEAGRSQRLAGAEARLGVLQDWVSIG